ncbi:ArsC family reductase [Govanella unica]|uniref:ArsC family reductase n=1 Tax=Govanella unica TaxID=2975056 RepID=A0A9X3Z7A3_9PROT|nr:ArsC family reductase [Govania unica]MDA5194040.1 ArsC family reductase [Govania unica]
MIKVYGIPNCDTVKKARNWLDGFKIDYQFHDYRKDGISTDMVTAWAAELGFEALLNRRGTTWRGLPDSDKADVDSLKAVALMVAHPALIKRPLFDTGAERYVGFGADVQARLRERT